jgi:nucleotide-binding universal stress UspA family protein
MNPQRLLVGDDGSPGAAAARAWADTLAVANGAAVTVARVVDEHEGRGPLGARDDKVREYRGRPAPTLMAVADDLDADLLVVGRRGAGGFDALRLGGVASQIAEYTTRPLVVVPGSTRVAGDGWPFRAMAVGHDGLETGVQALRWTANIATLSSSHVVVVHAFDSAPAFMAAGLESAYDRSRARVLAQLESDWSAALRDAGVDYSTVLEDGGPAGVLLDVIYAEAVELAVVGRRSAAELGGIAMGSAAHRVLAWAPCPVVVVPLARRSTR